MIRGSAQAEVVLKTVSDVVISQTRILFAAPAEEATDIYRRLAEGNPDAYLPNLTASLNNLGIRLSDLGRREESLAAIEEAVTIRRRLAEANPDAFLPDLAMSLNNLGVRLVELGRLDEGSAAIEEAVSGYQRLAEANPDAYLPNLARALWAHAWICVNVNADLPRALESVTEAIGLYNALSAQMPQTFASEQISAYRTLAEVLESLGRSGEAAGLRRRLDLTTGSRRHQTNDHVVPGAQ